MKTIGIASLLLVGFVNCVTADELKIGDSKTTLPVEQYSYSTNLDIAKVISISNIPQVCEVVPAQMIYEDSQGKRHILEYRVMGDGCRN